MKKIKQIAVLVLLLALVPLCTKNAYAGMVTDGGGGTFYNPTLLYPASWAQNIGDLPYVRLANGWHIDSTSTGLYGFTKNAYLGRVCYCLAPGVHFDDGAGYISKMPTYMDSIAARNDLLSKVQMEELISLVMAEGFCGDIERSFYTDEALGKDAFAHIWATQILLWEIISGERTPDFSHVCTPGFGVCRDAIKMSNPIYFAFDNYYKKMEKNIKNALLIPSFSDPSPALAASSAFEMKYEKGRYSLTLTDANGVLPYFSVSCKNPDIEFDVNGNTLSIYSDKPVFSAESLCFTRNINTSDFLVYGLASENTFSSANNQILTTSWTGTPAPHVKTAYAFLKTSPGELDLFKSSSCQWSSERSSYSLEGAVYGIYGSGDALHGEVDESTLIGYMTTDAAGRAVFLSGITAERMYYIKEKTAPKGFLADPRVYTVFPRGTEENAAEIRVSDEPVESSLCLSLTKERSDGLSGGASLAGTRFTVKYYDIDPASCPSDHELEKEKPDKTWMIEAKNEETGGVNVCTARLDREHLVSGSDELFCSKEGKPVLPIGFYTLCETQSAPGYSLENTQYYSDDILISEKNSPVIFKVDTDGSVFPKNINIENLCAKDSPVLGKPSIKKLDSSTGMPVPGECFFDIISLNDFSVIVRGKTFECGETVFSGAIKDGSFYSEEAFLPCGSYKAVETTAPEGYLLSGNTELFFDIKEDGSCEFGNTSKGGCFIDDKEPPEEPPAPPDAPKTGDRTSILASLTLAFFAGLVAAIKKSLRYQNTTRR